MGHDTHRVTLAGGGVFTIIFDFLKFKVYFQVEKINEKRHKHILIGDIEKSKKENDQMESGKKKEKSCHYG